MKFTEQLDAHVQSYHEELKRKERERIKKLFQYLKEKREQLTLNEHPIKRIHYSINMAKPINIAPILLEKISFDSTVELKREKLNINTKCDVSKISTSNPPKFEAEKVILPKFNLNNFVFQMPDIRLNEITPINVHNNNLSYVLEEENISLDTFENVNLYQYSITGFALPKQFNIALDMLPQVVLYQNSITEFALPKQFNIALDMLPQVALYQNTMPKFTLPDSIINLPILKTGNIHFQQIQYEKTFPEIELTAFLEPVMPSYKIKINSKKLYKKVEVKLKTTGVKIPSFKVSYKQSLILIEKKEFSKPDLDFSEVLKKLQSILNENLS